MAERLWPFAALPVFIFNLGAVILFAGYYGVQSQRPELMPFGEGQLFFILYAFIAVVEWLFFAALLMRLRHLGIPWCSLLAADEHPFRFRLAPALLVLIGFNGVFALYMLWVHSFLGGWPVYGDWTAAQRIFMVGVVPITAAVTEEFIWRGYLLSRLLQRMSPRRAILLAALSFALIHGIMPDRFAVTFMLGLIAGYYYYRQRKLLPLIAAHWLLDAWSFSLTAYLT